MATNLYCSEQKSSSKEFRENFDKIFNKECKCNGKCGENCKCKKEKKSEKVF